MSRVFGSRIKHSLIFYLSESKNNYSGSEIFDLKAYLKAKFESFLDQHGKLTFVWLYVLTKVFVRYIPLANLKVWNSIKHTD